ncbi:MAG: HEAT repeat domain-containing protein [Isosphaeraceae bacterium]|nr:HEAT repeat domain-containing protein [Isosphaeraceae bacterium]
MRTVLVLALMTTIGIAAPRPAPAADLPQVPEGWKIELVARAPEILFPTAVVEAPDGTLYLGQDPMDMPGPPTEPIDSVLALKAGRLTRFADKLWSVMGLEWVDDTLYVVHAPYLSGFRDTDGDGKADQRVDLVTGLGPKLPGFSGINDHVASGMRLGMDGFLYVAVGDKGIPKGVGRDGKTIQLFGGGVIRVRPDGTDLEVVSSGERNPLSVMLSATDDVFTYGNDDDSKKWPNSLTHHIVGGHYGYPYQFLTAPHRALPIVDGQLGGSGTQGVCYNEQGLPAEYQGDLFVSDWGLQTVFRYKLEKSGGTFRLKGKRTPFVTKGAVRDFRPFSLAVTNDGTGFWLVDWAFDGWLADGPQTGRLYRLSYNGPERVAPVLRPSGDGPAAWQRALDHPALSVRLESQRRLVRRGVAEVEPLANRLRQETPRAGRLHALWALDAIGTPEARRAILAALGDRDAEVRLQAARSAGVRADRAAGASLSALLRDPDPAVRREAAIALGKTGDRAAAPALLAALAERDTFAAWSIRGALRRLDAWDEEALLASLLDASRRDHALLLADEAWALPVVNALGRALVKTDTPAFRARIVATLAGLYRRYPAWSGHWFGTNPLAGAMPQRTEDWDAAAMKRVLLALALGLRDADAVVRLQAIAGLREVGPPASPLLRDALARESDEKNLAALAGVIGSSGDHEAAPDLAKLVQDPARPEDVRVAALDALGMLAGPQALRARFALAYDRKAPASLVARVLPELGREGVLPLNDAASFLESPAPEVRAAALLAMNTRRPVPADVKDAVLARLDDAAPEVRFAALEAAVTLKLRDAIPRLINVAHNERTKDEAVRALAAFPDERAFPIYLAALNDRSPETRRAAESALAALGDRVRGPLESEARAGRLQGPAALAVEHLLARFVPLVDWRVIGPFPRTTARVFLGERSIDFAKTHSGVEGRTIAWTPRAGDPLHGRVTLNDFKGDVGDRGGFGFDTNGSPDLCAFAYTEIASDRDRPALLRIGSSGTLTVTVNEQAVYDFSAFAGRPYMPETDLVRLELKQGKNRVLVRTRQGIGTWSFSVQLSQPSEALLSTRRAVASPDALRDFALRNNGDSKKGEALFFDLKGIGCAKCHAAAGRGTANVGPDLTGLALKYDKAEIIRSVLEPSNRIATGYQPALVATADGKVLTGLVRSESDTHIELVDAEAKITRIAKSTIEERRVGDVSLMPKGLAETLSAVEFADLISYLQSLKAAPAAVSPAH